MKTSMKHIDDNGKPTERITGKASITTVVVYVALFGGWLALQLHK